MKSRSHPQRPLNFDPPKAPGEPKRSSSWHAEILQNLRELEVDEMVKFDAQWTPNGTNTVAKVASNQNTQNPDRHYCTITWDRWCYVLRVK